MMYLGHVINHDESLLLAGLMVASVAATAVDWVGVMRRAGSSATYACTHEDDCTMDARAGAAGTLRDVIRLRFASDDPADAQSIVGLTRAEVLCAGVPQAALTQETHLDSVSEALPEEWAPTRAAKTNVQSTSPPDPKTLEARPCPAIVSSTLGMLAWRRGARGRTWHVQLLA